MPEGDTIHHAAHRIRPVLEGRVPDEIRTPHPRFKANRWPERLAGRAVTAVDARGKHLFLHFEGELALHSHLRMTGAWGVYGPGRRWGRAPRRAPAPRGGGRRGAGRGGPGGTPAAARRPRTPRRRPPPAPPPRRPRRG